MRDKSLIAGKADRVADESGVVSITLQKGAKLIAVADRSTQLGQLADGVSLSFRSDDGFDHMYHSSPIESRWNTDLRINGSGRLHRLTLQWQREYSLSVPTRRRSRSKQVKKRVLNWDRCSAKLTLSGNAPPVFNSEDRRFGIANPGPGRFAVHTDVDGAFELRGLLPGEYLAGDRHFFIQYRISRQWRSRTESPTDGRHARGLEISGDSVDSPLIDERPRETMCHNVSF